MCSTVDSAKGPLLPRPLSSIPWQGSDKDGKTSAAHRVIDGS